MSHLLVVSPGLHLCLQDRGRAGYEGAGVPCSGAFDLGAWESANFLVGNDTGFATGGPATLELTLGGLRLGALAETTIAVCGAHSSAIVSRGTISTELPTNQPIHLPQGAELRLGTVKTGLRSYLAIPGGFHARPVLGSCSLDTASQLGPKPLAAGDELRGGSAPVESRLKPATSDRPSIGRLQTTLGPHADITPGMSSYLTDQTWTVTPDSSRSGVRLTPGSRNLTGLAIEKSVPTTPGTIQLLPNGNIVIIGPDGPTTGGYPFIGFLSRFTLDDVAQLRPGQRVGFDI